MMIKRLVVTSKELRAFAGSLSFVAGLVPHLRPFLSSTCAAPSYRAKHSGKLKHTKRFRAALG